MIPSTLWRAQRSHPEDPYVLGCFVAALLATTGRAVPFARVRSGSDRPSRHGERSEAIRLMTVAATRRGLTLGAEAVS
jgi:hypothetical protein